MELTKKQVMNIVKLLKASRNNSLKDVQGTRNGWAITDSYQAYLFETGTDNTDKIIKFETIETWYKLASAKDLLELDQLESENGKTTDIMSFFNNDQLVDINNFYLDATKLATAQAICGTDFIDVNVYRSSMYRINEDEKIKGLVLGARKTQ